jgi:hypothetical protein
MGSTARRAVRSTGVLPTTSSCDPTTKAAQITATWSKAARDALRETGFADTGGSLPSGIAPAMRRLYWTAYLPRVPKRAASIGMKERPGSIPQDRRQTLRGQWNLMTVTQRRRLAHL